MSLLKQIQERRALNEAANPFSTGVFKDKEGYYVRDGKGNVTRHDDHASAKTYANKLVEDVDQIDELSKSTLKSYSDKAYDDSERLFHKGDHMYENKPKRRSHAEKILHKSDKRLAGSELADRKLEGKARVNTSEQVEQVDEGRRSKEEYKKAEKKHSDGFNADYRNYQIAKSDYNKSKDPRDYDIAAGYKHRAERHLAASSAARKLAKEEVDQINEGLRLIGTHKSDNGKHEAKVYHDKEWGEHRVKFFINGKHHEPSDYHTDDRKDAHDTAQHQLKNLDKLHSALKEDVDMEYIEELSKQTLGSYVKKSSEDRAAAGRIFVKTDQEDRPGRLKQLVRIRNRRHGIEKAVNRLTKEETLDDEDLDLIESLTLVEFDQLDEISKKTLDNYLNKNREGWNQRVFDRDEKNKPWTKELQKTHDKRYDGEDLAAAKLEGKGSTYRKNGVKKTVKVHATEETRRRLKDILDEAQRGRPKKARHEDGEIVNDPKANS